MTSRRMHVPAFALAIAALAGCAPDVGNGGTARTEAAFVTAGTPVHRRDSRDFTVEGRTVRFSHVAYGVQNDCSSGCFTSHVCAIEDGANVLLYFASWTRPEERPAAVDTACPGLPASTTTTRAPCMPPGVTHPLTATSEFQLIMTRPEGNPFGWCNPTR